MLEQTSKTIMIKHLTILSLTLLFLIPRYTSAQKFEKSKKVESPIELDDYTAIIYGLFIQRLGFTSGGFPQEIRVLNIVKNKIYTFNVKKTMSSSRENVFCYYIKPSIYKIISYSWTKSKWHGGEIHEEPIFKNIETSCKDYNKKWKPKF